MDSFRVFFSESNSGGRYRLDISHYNALADVRWDVDPPVKGERYSHRTATKVFRAKTRGNAVRNARREFTIVTGFNAEDPGCSCCGPPFQFYLIPTDQKMDSPHA